MKITVAWGSDPPSSCEGSRAHLWESYDLQIMIFSAKTCGLHQCSMTALMPRTGRNKMYLILWLVGTKTILNTLISSPQEEGGPCYITIHNGNNMQNKASHSFSAQAMDAMG